MSLDTLNPFHQSGEVSKWCFVEFWCGDEEKILEAVMEQFPDIAL